MGIPSYFSFIVKNHPTIIKKLFKGNMKINNFFLDSNSIIYDAVRNIDFTTDLNETTYSKIIARVIQKIEEYISIISPDNLVVISFDGSPPIAKLEQQRNRRYKSWYQNEVHKNIFKKTSEDPFNTAEITCGTKFMFELDSKIKNYFVKPEKYNVKKIIVSGSNEIGEGESKIFDCIRNSSHVKKDSTNIIYGLDADLIMLSINNLPVNKNIYLFRETPEFIQSIDSSLEPNEHYVLDIPLLAESITLDMNNDVELTEEQRHKKVYDYIFICFFLGNDFMPHFPSINIRTGGVHKMLNAYKATVGPDEILTDGNTIYWKNVRKMIQFLAELEETNFKNEMKKRDRDEKLFIPEDTPENRYKKFDIIPTKERAIEKYINPFKSGWEYRYYKSLFNIDINDDRRKQICLNYLEGLEWNMKYYTSGCVDWRWCYKYNYPPLLVDLIKYIPYFETSFFSNDSKLNKPVSQLVQLCYVLPRPSLKLLPNNLYTQIMKKYDYLYPSDAEFTWAYCKYFWESHVNLPEIDLNEIEEFVSNNTFFKK